MVDIFLGAIIFAIWSVILFYGKAIGLSMLLFIVPITCFIIHILEKRNEDLNKNAKFFLVPITLLSSAYLIYSNLFFNILNIIVIPILLVLMILGMYKEKFEIKFRLIGNILKVVAKPFIYIGEAFKNSKTVLKEKSKEEIDSKKYKNIKRVGKALMITIPVVFVIIWLLSSADQVFGNIFGKIIEAIADFIRGIQIGTVIEIMILTVFAFVYFLGFFYYITSKYEKIEEKENNRKKDSFTIKMILGALNFVYLIFCFIQIKSLFMRNVDINYAEYARQGFFQLMLVSIINLVTVLIAKEREMQDEKKDIYIKVMCIAMVVFTFIILISSAYRMYLYESAYGYTLLRLLVYCILFTETVLLIPTVLYIIDKKINLPIVYFGIVITIYICMNFANFDNIIAKRNVDRYLETGKIDLLYLEMDTGTDAVKQIIRILDEKENEVGIKPETRRYLQSMYDYLENEGMDFRNFNISKLIAKKQISSKIDELKKIDVVEQKTNMNYDYNYKDLDNTNIIESDFLGENENFYGVVRRKNNNEVVLSYTQDKYEPIIKYVYLKNGDINKVNVGDWIGGTGKRIGYNNDIPKIETTLLSITPQNEYKKKLQNYIYEKNKIETVIEYNYESEGRGDGFIYCSIYSNDGTGKPEGFIKVFYDENTKICLGNPDAPARENYEIIEHELAEIIFRDKVTNINHINADIISMIAD